MLGDIAEIEEFVVRFEGRGPGTDAERRAARYLAGRLEQLGRAAEIEPAWVWPNYALAHVANAVLAILASVVAVASGAVGTALAAIALLSALGDLSGRFYLLRRLTGRRATQTVVSREEDPRPGTLILVAHYDAPRTGAVFGRPSERGAALASLLRRPIGPFDTYTLSLAAVLIVCALRAAGAAGLALSIAQFVATAVLIVSVPLFADIALSGVVPGASDNASGVATVLRLVERYGGALDHFRIWALFPGASEGLQLGMRAWLQRHRDELDPTRTVFLNVDAVGAGTVRYLTREGFLVTRRAHPQLVQLCDLLAEEDADEGRYGARRLASRSASDATAAAAARFPAISISCRGALDRAPNSHLATDTPQQLDEAALERAFGFCSELIELIDERIGPELEPAPSLRDAAG